MDSVCLVPYVKLDWRTEISVKKYRPDARLVSTAESDYSYRDLLKHYWKGERDLIIVEQDIELTENPFYGGCRHDWCTYAYQGPPHLGYLYRSLGCTRFSAKLQRRFPFSEFIEYEMIWQRIDVRIQRILWECNGIKPHVHGKVIHHNDYRNVLDGLGKDKVAWNVLIEPDGTYRPVAKELQPDGQIFIYEVDTETGKRGRFIKKAAKGEEWNWRLNILT